MDYISMLFIIFDYISNRYLKFFKTNGKILLLKRKYLE